MPKEKKPLQITTNNVYYLCFGTMIFLLYICVWMYGVERLPIFKKPKRTGNYSREEETCDAMALIYGKPFVKVRPPFLVNPETNRRLEIDCYNEELKVGAEFNGIGHYIYPNPFHHSKSEFEALQRRDAYKVKTCKEKGVVLFVVPDTIKKGKIYNYLVKEKDSLES
jgi:hypothetical protein